MSAPILIMLIDDDHATNFIHERVIKLHNPDARIISFLGAEDALGHIKSNTNAKPDIIFLDLNMPAMDGWEFLDEYYSLPPESVEGTDINILTTSLNPDHVVNAQKFGLEGKFYSKPLNQEDVEKACQR